LQAVRRNTRGMRAECSHVQLDVVQHGMGNVDAEYTVQSHMNSHAVVHETARKDLLELEARGLLVRHRVGKAYAWVPARDLASVLRQRRSKRSTSQGGKH